MNSPSFSNEVASSSIPTLALSGLMALCLSGCGDGGSKPKAVARMDTLVTPAPVTVATAADQASAANDARIQARNETQPTTSAAPSAPAAAAQTTPTLQTSTTPTTDAAQIQGIPAPPKTTIHQGGNVLGVAGIAFTIPADWKQVPPSSGLRAAQYAMPGPGGDAEVAVFYFGPGQGGSVDQNVKRWVAQFKSEDPAAPQLAGEVGTLESDTLKLTMVRTQGTYNPGMMGGPNVDNTPKPGFALFGLVVEGGPEGNLFIKITGPKATLDKQKEPLEEFARSTRLSKFR